MHTLQTKLKCLKFKTIILPIVLYGCENWSLILREDRRIKVLRIHRSKRDEIIGDGGRGNCITRSCVTFNLHQILTNIN
jgi:hypothetical protein